MFTSFGIFIVSTVKTIIKPVKNLYEAALGASELIKTVAAGSSSCFKKNFNDIGQTLDGQTIELTLDGIGHDDEDKIDRKIDKERMETYF